MAKTLTLYTCTTCDAQFPKWLGQCTECGAWGTIGQTPTSTPASAAASATHVNLDDIPTLGAVDARATAPVPTGITEFDQAIGGGIVPGALLLLAGEPGIGKSTLILQVAGAVARHSPSSRGGAGGLPCEAAAKQGGGVLYVTGEETAAQIKRRAERLGVPTAHIRLAATTDAHHAAAVIAKLRPALAIVDSVQTLSLPDVPTGAGGVTQVRAITNLLLHTAKTTGVPTIAIGHVTKGGDVAGPKTLEHLVDQVALFEGDPASDLRILRTTKNRYGPTDVAGVFTMAEHGLIPCADPASAFLAHGEASPGSVVAASTLGKRTLLVEIQALVTRSAFGQPQRRAVGLDITRLHVLLAILAQHGGVALASSDVHLATASGIRIDDPAVDLAVAGALASAAADRVLPFDVLIGELGLDGSVRPCRGIDRRIAEAVRIGRARIAVPSHTKPQRGATLAPIAHIRELVQRLRVIGSPPPTGRGS